MWYFASLCMLNRKMLQGQILNFNNNLMKCGPAAVLMNRLRQIGKTKLSRKKYEVYNDSHNWQFARRICVAFTVHIQGIHKRMVRFQKLTRNLFLTLHGHNLHRQQR